MGEQTSWTIVVNFDEDPQRTRADAVLTAGQEEIHVIGRSEHTDVDDDVPMVGKELAAANALRSLVQQLESVATETAEFVEGHTAALAMN